MTLDTETAKPDTSFCAVRGVLHGGRAMCGHVRVGTRTCGYQGDCEHQTAIAPVAPEIKDKPLPTRQEDPIGWAALWLGDDLMTLLKARAVDLRLSLSSSDVPGKRRDALARLKRLTNRGILRCLDKKENSQYIFVPAKFLADHLLAEAKKAES